MSKTEYKNASAHRDAIMNANAGKSMSVVVEMMAREIMMKGKPMGAARAKAYYVDAVKTGRCPGKIDVAPKVAKAPKAPKVKAPADRKEVLKAAAKRAGIHKDSIAEATANDDPLNLAAPESLTRDDLKNLL